MVTDDAVADVGVRSRFGDLVRLADRGEVCPGGLGKFM